MPQAFTFKDHKREIRLIHSRIYIAGGLMMLLMLILMGRIFYLQVIMHEHFTTLSQHNRIQTQPLTPIRGLIFSRDNVLLADNRPAFRLAIIPEEVNDIGKLLKDLGGIISIKEYDIKRFREQLEKKRRFEDVILKFNLSDEEVAKISVNRHRFPGVNVVAGLNRYYPLGANLAHAIGYVGMIDESELKQLDESNYSGTTHMGKIGVEKAYEHLLHGRVGYRQVEVNAQGREIREFNITPPEPGKNIQLTLDVSLQNLAVEALGEKRGAIVAIDPRDGGVLALVSSPSYDPNSFVNGIDTKYYGKLLKSKHTPLLNRVLQGKYPPGSTIKPFIGLAALNAGVRIVHDETWCPGWFSLAGDNHKYRDWKKGGHGYTNLTTAIAWSCDVYFYTLGVDLGINRLKPALEQFGFGKKTGIDIGGEVAGLIPSREWKHKALGQPWFPGETVITGIGQGYTLVTPIQLALATMIVSNHGKVIRPHLLDNISDPISNESINYTPDNGEKPVVMNKSEYWDDIIHAMTEVVFGEHGTARRTGLGAGYKFAGKTGTAQVVALRQDKDVDKEDIPEEQRDHALFIAFAPVEKPEIVIAIVIEHGGSGSSGAAPIARRLFDHYFNNKQHKQG